MSEPTAPPSPAAPPAPLLKLEGVGMRFDVFRSVDLKAQFDHAKAFDYGTPFINTQPSFNNKANIFSLAADFVF